MNIFRLKNNFKIVLDDSTVLSTTECTDEFYTKALAYISANDVESLLDLFIPERTAIKEKLQEIEGITQNSNIVSFDKAYYIKSISELTVPEYLAKAIAKAEQENNQVLLDTYLNFWKLLSCNPNEEVRNNLLWFIEKHNIKITSSGLLVTYRNVDIRDLSKYNKKLLLLISTQAAKLKYNTNEMSNYTIYSNNLTGEYEVVEYIYDYYYRVDNTYLFIGRLDNLYETIILENDELEFTDHHTHSTSIKLGKLITMPREKVDSDSSHECSSGLKCSPII